MSINIDCLLPLPRAAPSQEAALRPLQPSAPASEDTAAGRHSLCFSVGTAYRSLKSSEGKVSTQTCR